MIRQCLSNKNKSATVPKSKKKSELNKAYIYIVYYIIAYIKLVDMCKLNTPDRHHPRS